MHLTLVENAPVLVHAVLKSQKSVSLTFSCAVTEETARSFVKFEGNDFKLEKVGKNLRLSLNLFYVLGFQSWHSFTQILHGSPVDFDFGNRRLERFTFATWCCRISAARRRRVLPLCVFARGIIFFCLFTLMQLVFSFIRWGRVVRQKRRVKLWPVLWKCAKA